MKKTLLVLLCTIFALYSQSCEAASVGSIKKDAGYISLNASETKEVEPNLAKVSFAVENTAENAQKAAAENNNVSNKIIEALKAVTKSGTDVIKTNNFSVRPNYSTTKDGKRVIKNYTAVNSITVETKETSKVANFIDTAIANGANRTDGLSYSYINNTSVCNEMYPALIKKLTDQASVLAQSAGTSIDGIKYINASCNMESVVSNGRFLTAKAMGASADSSENAVSTPVEAGKVKVRVYVNADFYVK